jgi:hypothetical protein
VGTLLVLQLLALLPTAVAMGASPPAIAITSPGAGETVKGTVHVEATATASAGDYPTAIVFYDGVNEIARVNCQNQQSCTASVEWHATGLSGQHSLTAEAETNEGAKATSAAVPVTVVSPPPTVAITSPAAGATIEGTVTVVASAATDPSQEDYPTEISVYDGVNDIGHIDCQAQRTCQGQVEWQATGLTGAHTLTAVVSTHRSLSVTSAPANVTVLSPPPKVSITHPANHTPLRGTITIAVSGQTARSQDEYPTEIVVNDGTSEIGSVSCQGQQTCAGTVQWDAHGLKGVHVLTAVIHTNRNREATSSPVYVGGHLGKPHAKVSCHLHSLHVRRGRYDNGSCTAYGVPQGTGVVVQYRVSGQGWTNGAKGSISAAGRYFFKFRSRHRVTFEVSVLVGASSRYEATRTVLGTVHVT